LDVRRESDLGRNPSQTLFADSATYQDVILPMQADASAAVGDRIGPRQRHPRRDQQRPLTPRRPRTRRTTVPTDQLTVRERATLLALMAEARELTNAELRDGPYRRRLNEQKLVTSRKVGRGFAHELTDDGWAWCAAELSAERPDRAGYLGGACYALLAGLARRFAHNGERLSDVFQPDVEKLIRSAYRQVAGTSGGWVGLAELREELLGVSRESVDAELERMASTPGVHVQAESNQKTLTETDRAAAVRFGGDERHLLMIEAG
jgi:hypothetical protein